MTFCCLIWSPSSTTRWEVYFWRSSGRWRWGSGGGGGITSFDMCQWKSQIWYILSFFFFFFLNLIFGLNVHRDHMWSIRDGVDIWWGYKSDTFWGLYLTLGLHVHRDHMWSVRDGVDILCWVGGGGGGREGGFGKSWDSLKWNSFFCFLFFYSCHIGFSLSCSWACSEKCSKHYFATFCFLFYLSRYFLKLPLQLTQRSASSWSCHCNWHTVVHFFLELSLQLTQWSTSSWSCHCNWQ